MFIEIDSALSLFFEFHAADAGGRGTPYRPKSFLPPPCKPPSLFLSPSGTCALAGSDAGGGQARLRSSRYARMRPASHLLKCIRAFIACQNSVRTLRRSLSRLSQHLDQKLLGDGRS